MKRVSIEIPEIPHGHGLSFKKGLADGLLDSQEHKNTCHETHFASYQRGHDIGANLVKEIASSVKA